MWLSIASGTITQVHLLRKISILRLVSAFKPAEVQSVRLSPSVKLLFYQYWQPVRVCIKLMFGHLLLGFPQNRRHTESSRIFMLCQISVVLDNARKYGYNPMSCHAPCSCSVLLNDALHIETHCMTVYMTSLYFFSFQHRIWTELLKQMNFLMLFWLAQLTGIRKSLQMWHLRKRQQLQRRLTQKW